MRKSIAHNTLWLTGSLVGQKVLSFLYFALIARSLGVEQTGMYVFAVSFVALFGIIADSGMTPVSIRELAKERDHSQFSPDLTRLLVASVRIKLLLVILAGLSAIGAVVWMGYESTIVWLVVATVGVMILDAVHLFAYGLLRGLQNLRYEAVGMFVGQAVVVVLGWYVLHNDLSVFYLIGALGIGSMLNVFQSVFYVWKAGVRIPLFFAVTRLDALRLVKMAWPFALAGVLARGYAQIDIVLLSKLSGISAVGLYSVPSKMVFAFQFLPIAMAAALYPAMSRAYATHSQSLSRIVHSSMLYLAMIAIPLIVMLSSMAWFIVVIVFGVAYESSVVLLHVLSFSMLFGFLDFPLGALLNATHNQTKQTFSMFLTLCVNLVLNLALIPQFGALGATVAAVVGQATLFFSGLYFVRGLVVWDTFFIFKHSMKIIFSAAVMSLVGWLAYDWFFSLIHMYEGMGQLLVLLAGLCALGMVYVVCILALKVVTFSDIRGFMKHDV